MLEAEEIGTKDLKTLRCRDFPSGPVVKTAGDGGLIPGQGRKIHKAWPKEKAKL